MKTKRMFHKENILNFRKKVEKRKTDKINMTSGGYSNNEMHICICDVIYVTISELNFSIFIELPQKVNLPSSNAEEINAAFNTVVVPKKRNSDDLYKISNKKKRTTKRDEEYYIPYSAPDKHTEDG